MQSEISDIQFVEQADIKLLEDLLVEFEDDMDASSCSFWDFISLHWEERMKQVVEERTTHRLSEAGRAKEVGVLIYGPKPEMHLKDDHKPKVYSWEWFERRVAKIMERA
jgi:hypothetical protein